MGADVARVVRGAWMGVRRLLMPSRPIWLEKAVDDPMQQKPPEQEAGEPKQQDNRKPLRHRHRCGGPE